MVDVGLAVLGTIQGLLLLLACAFAVVVGHLR